MKRTIYVSGLTTKSLAHQARVIPYWLLRVSELRRYPEWLDPYVTNRSVMWSAGSGIDRPDYMGYLSYIDKHIIGRHAYLQYDDFRDPNATTWYLKDMRRRGYNPLPILQPGGNSMLLHSEDLVFLSGLLQMDDMERSDYLDKHLMVGIRAKVHLLGIKDAPWFAPYAAAIQGDHSLRETHGFWRQRCTERSDEFGEQWIPYSPMLYRYRA
ncbi:hypothetical protein [Paenibacillus polymyxa]|uniref:hypothetical protein n=1 Tax=Paenibacillus polymyxa TaxID=1406 RepID=UPI00111BA9EA|nr:hypothetical protein [Paenibacillus polymyxa]QDA30237.1 hypothetical protein FGY93_25305 [Paenibacillus polymyxa]